MSVNEIRSNTISYLIEPTLCKTINWEELMSLMIDEMVIKEIKHQLSGARENQLHEIVDKISEILQVHTKSEH